ncbi:TonB-dependent receptor plug domain-containing protein [Avrilella dinanensis]|uniref:TonB-dependent receptor plug domain-containing protein n=1 Tax=Avrilella dinanensis TaxID=2008672 RepID=UPI002409B46E|nr:TonB-dependent receptor [Avrilella dinanensis]
MKPTTIFTMFMVGCVYAQSPNDSIQQLDEIIIQSNRLQIPVSQQNRNVQIITSEDIEKLPVQTLSEILYYADGVDIRQRGGFGTQADISIDGGSFEQTLVLLNGVKIIDHQTAHNSLNLPVPVEAIERIEILRGPAARIYGVNALTGAVNIVTKKADSNQVFAHVFGGSNFKKDEENDSGMYNNRGVQFGLTLSKNKFNQQLYGSHESGSGYQYNTAFHNNRLLYLGDYTINENNQIEAQVGWVRSSFGANGFYAAPGDREAKEIVSTTMAAIKSTHQLSDRLRLVPQIGYRYNYDDYRYIRQNISTARSQHYTNAVNAEVNANYAMNEGEIGVGTEMRYEQINSNNLGKHERNNYGLYAEYKNYSIQNLIFTVGTYVNYNTVFGWQIFPGIDASLSVTEKDKITFSAGSGQRIPSFNDLYLNQTGNIGNEFVESERAYQFEGGYQHIDDSWTLKANVFHRNIYDFIDWTRVDDTEPFQSNNVGKLQTFGGNLAFGYDWKNWNFKLTYTYLNAEMNLDEDILSKYRVRSFRHQIINTINYTHKNWSVSLANRFNERVGYQDYFLTDFRLSYQYKNWVYYADMQNIFDTQYNEAGALPMPGRWATIGIKTNLNW